MENQNIEKFWRELNGLDRFRKKRDELDYMGDGGLVPLTGRQRACIFGILKNLGADASDYGVRSVGDMTLAEASELIDDLMAEQDANRQSSRYNRSLF